MKQITLKKLESYNTINSLRRISKSCLSGKVRLQPSASLCLDIAPAAGTHLVYLYGTSRSTVRIHPALKRKGLARSDYHDGH